MCATSSRSLGTTHCGSATVKYRDDRGVYNRTFEDVLTVQVSRILYFGGSGEQVSPVL